MLYYQKIVTKIWENKMIEYRWASHEDIDQLVLHRMNFIEIDKDDGRYALIHNNCDAYFRKAFETNTCDVILAEEDKRVIGTGIVFYYNSVPSAFNPTGKNAYVTSVYVEQKSRRQGIGMAIMKQLLDISERKGYPIVMLNASEMGKAMYQKLGFAESENGMILKRN